MRKLYIGLGILSTICGLTSVCFEAARGMPTAIVLASAVVVLFGAALLVAAFKNLRGHWAFPIGLVFVAFAFVFLEVCVTAPEVFGPDKATIFLSCFFGGCGLLLLHTALQFHRMSQLLDKFRGEPNKPLVPTPTSVTPAAKAPGAPQSGAAHL